MLNHIYYFISCNDFKDILDSLLERGLKQLSPGVFGLFRSSIHQMLHVITLSRKQTIFALPCIRCEGREARLYPIFLGHMSGFYCYSLTCINFFGICFYHILNFKIVTQNSYLSPTTPTMVTLNPPHADR